jgi:hypothetical protein
MGAGLDETAGQQAALPEGAAAVALAEAVGLLGEVIRPWAFS